MSPIFFTVTPRTHHNRAYRRLARTLKTALRRDQLRATSVCEETNVARRGPRERSRARRQVRR
jgi:hypothetical protein